MSSPCDARRDSQRQFSGTYLEKPVREIQRFFLYSEPPDPILQMVATVSDFEWSVLDQNQAAIDVDESFGAKPKTEWLGYRLSGDALQQLANSQYVVICNKLIFFVINTPYGA